MQALKGTAIGLRIYAFGLAVTASAVALSLLAGGARLEEPWIEAALAEISDVAEHGTVRVGPTTHLSLLPLQCLRPRFLRN